MRRMAGCTARGALPDEGDGAVPGGNSAAPSARGPQRGPLPRARGPAAGRTGGVPMVPVGDQDRAAQDVAGQIIIDGVSHLVCHVFGMSFK